MVMNIERADERGLSKLSWLTSRFSYSFADYHNQKRMNFGALRVVNDDIIQPGQGFGTHPHRDMEIITIVLSGALEHKDSTGSSGVIKPGEVQVMSAGKGVLHSEFNHSHHQEVSLFQIWIQTAKKGVIPRYEQRAFEFEKNKLIEIVSGTREGSGLMIYQDAKIFRGKLDTEAQIEFKLEPNKGVFVMIVEGSAEINNKVLNRRDSAKISKEKVVITAKSELEIILIEVPMNY